MTDSGSLDHPAATEFASPFPPTERVIYDRNPLEAVICQLRVPTNLRIDVEPPAAFQRAIRTEYPGFKQTTNVVVPGLPAELNALLATVPSGSAYDFVSEDGNWTVGLTREFLALSTRAYQRWEEFKERLADPLAAYLTEYDPPFFARTGLRYQNVIQPSVLGLDGADWADLVQAHVAGELVNRDLARRTKQATRELVFDLGDGNRVQLRHGIARRNEGAEDCYLIDADFFTEERKTRDDAIRALDEFHQHAGRLFRWCITDRVHESLGPQPV